MNIKNIIFTIIFLLLLILVSPRIKFKNEFLKKPIPKNIKEIDHYLLKEELQFNLEKNTKKEIIWYEEVQKTKYSVVYIHGFGASKNEIYPVPNNIAKALKANLFFTRLKGHGINNKNAFRGITTQDWLGDIDEAIKIGKLIGDRLILIGTSNGGAASIWALANYPDEINSAILISPNIFPYDKRTNIVYYPWGRQIAHLITGGYNKFETKEDKRKEHMSIKSYSSKVQHVDAIIAMMGLVTLLNSYNFDEIKTPLIITHTPNDRTVDPIKINEFIKNYGGEKKDIPIILLEDSQAHVPIGNQSYKSAQNTSYFTKYAVDFINKTNK
ncbi:alpha/beta hydrolase [Borreliella yangtzensis]|uniref:Pimeloyl-ACP methyl ester carboxylesterase n=1 Tax=Borreliella yangtzensis TaxID=683292 RepID=A0ABR6P8S5_9SPIR|nr:alpha/beta hydrolase [Borreliella yangtzensis]MBB6042631.1 pimeloyl-ACP methyl ester carboxylesterase [Borreliella yangtzensis]WKC73595.1 alpha/beta hydrolase [Borreliella yangtzensis]WKC74511.1 alpha/beta hydrolase [Borreliella yangtzensis]